MRSRRCIMSFRDRAEAFCSHFGIRVPILMAPMVGASAPILSITVANAGGLGACGALLMQPQEILAWARVVRQSRSGAFPLNLWIPDPPPVRNPEHEGRVRAFLASWGPEMSPKAGDSVPPAFNAQWEALIEAAPPIASSIMGLFPPEDVRRLKAKRIAWFAVTSTVAEAEAAEAAGAYLG
ncbi:nitronate monooxygenase [Microvirga roseola]|uniref:nitronate monooxygenase n=1 Tax=Microvirga roseola TaxID=2883126 RepID=UPI002AC31D5E|nr:nitronate monooxygenase [Microvirga roseola]